MKTLGKVALYAYVSVMILFVLWILFAVGLMVEWKKETVVVDIPNSENRLVFKEYMGFKHGHFDVYLRRPWHLDQHIGRGELFDGSVPFSNGHYELIWEEDTVTVCYNNDGRWTEVRLEFPP